MDGVALLHRARDAGLHVEAAGEMLKITGPKRAEPVVRLLAEHKPEVLAAAHAPAKCRSTGRSGSWLGPSSGSMANAIGPAAQRIAWGDLQNEWHKLTAGVGRLGNVLGAKNPLASRSRRSARLQSRPLGANRLPH